MCKEVLWTTSGATTVLFLDFHPQEGNVFLKRNPVVLDSYQGSIHLSRFIQHSKESSRLIPDQLIKMLDILLKL